MFFGAIDKLAYSNLKCELEDLKRENLLLKQTNDVYQKRLVGEMETASFAIDWDAMKVFSIERVWDNGLPKTILGHMLSEPVITTEGEGDQKVTYRDIVREWTLYCSISEHERLVKEFNAWKGTNK